MKQHTEAEEQAVKILTKNNITTYPVDLKRIAERENITVLPLSDFSDISGKIKKEMSKLLFGLIDGIAKVGVGLLWRTSWGIIILIFQIKAANIKIINLIGQAKLILLRLERISLQQLY